MNNININRDENLIIGYSPIYKLDGKPNVIPYSDSDNKGLLVNQL